QVLAERHAGESGAYRPKLAAKIGRRVRLHVIGVDVARTAGHHHHDDRATEPLRPTPRFRLKPKQLRQHQPADAERAHAQEAPAAHAVTEPLTMSEEGRIEQGCLRMAKSGREGRKALDRTSKVNPLRRGRWEITLSGEYSTVHANQHVALRQSCAKSRQAALASLVTQITRPPRTRERPMWNFCPLWSCGSSLLWGRAH